MTREEAVEKINKLSVEVSDSAELGAIASTRYDAHMQLYNMACKQGDRTEIDNQRVILHAQLDAILDATYDVYMKRHEIDKIRLSVG